MKTMKIEFSPPRPFLSQLLLDVGRSMSEHAFSTRAWLVGFNLACFAAGAGDVRFQTLRSFSGSDGLEPYAGLVMGSDGALYGTTFYGGPAADGTVFKINQDGTGYTVLHGFVADYGAAEPNEPRSELIEGSDGVLYGTTWDSGVGWDPRPGVVYRMKKDGSGFGVVQRFFTNGLPLYGFGSPGNAALVEGENSTLYGTTLNGGTNEVGIVFKIDGGLTSLTVLHEFGSTDDGAYPAAGLTLGSDGTLYGTTASGGTNGGGTVFALEMDGGGYRILHHFGSVGDGGNPRARLILGSDGLLYGTTSPYPNDTCTVFKLKPDGSGYVVLVHFGANFDQAGVVEGRDGALYGTISSDGGDAVFRLGKDGTGYRKLYTFDGPSGPASGLTQGSDYAFYGTTLFGGPDNGGIIFKVWAAEAPEILDIAATNGVIQVRVSGQPTANYQVLRSTNLKDWIAQTPFTMPSSGVYTFSDDPRTNRLAYYRAALAP